MSDLFRLSIELPASSHRLEEMYLTEAEARLEAERLFGQNSCIRSVAVFLYRYPLQHNPHIIDCYDGSWQGDLFEEKA